MSDKFCTYTMRYFCIFYPKFTFLFLSVKLKSYHIDNQLINFWTYLVTILNSDICLKSESFHSPQLQILPNPSKATYYRTSILVPDRFWESSRKIQSLPQMSH